MKYFFIFITSVLVGCTSIKNEPSFLASSLQCDTESNFCIDFQNTMNNRNWTDNWTGPDGNPTAHTISNALEGSDYIRADFYNLNTPCSPRILAISEYTVKTIPLGGNATGLWGRANLYDGSRNEGFEYDDAWVCQGSLGGAKYSFCSEKDGRTVVICLLQVTQDEAMAESIFRTFRWTE